ncbi:MAG: RnfABCDGE type electron transport complex subunit B [Rikenellaceae bacterium]|jgi:Na+-translocating ferredoxin:NAD+ oxidoreductase RNF subunit RnfB|nr:RnfABCDGE type electron transport complex subunit B [Rikenellaceae bacterium]
MLLDSTLLYTVLILCAVGVIAAALLYVVAQRFRVEEDERIDVVAAKLPGANCGGCGSAGCRNFAEKLVASEDLAGLFCPVGGAATMKDVADYLGRAPVEKAPQTAVVRCGGSCAKRPHTNLYDGAASCAMSAMLYGGQTGCIFGCLGGGDCAAACNFDALSMNALTGLPEVDQTRCTACGACAKACPKLLIELRNKGFRDRRVYVSCRNKDKGGVARKSCAAACIGCGKCVKACAFEAIALADNLAYIDSNKCRLCRKCVAECPTGAIVETGFPALKQTKDG